VQQIRLHHIGDETDNKSASRFEIRQYAAVSLEAGNLHFATEGTPQGGVVSPMLSNIFLHHVLDKWFEDVVRPRMRGRRPWYGSLMIS
jgi:retron-type reverse transcriptase